MRESRSNIFKYVLLGFVVAALLVSLKILIEHTYWGHRAELLAFELLQGQLSTFNPREELPVVVVDIGGIGQGSGGEIVDLEKLKEVVEELAAQKPRAIAIDVELTPASGSEKQNASGDQTEQIKLEQRYFDFLDFCLQKIKGERGIPVFLAVGERTVAAPEQWLGGEKYKQLAATMIIPREETTRMPIWFKAGPQQSEKLFSLSASLARAYQKSHLPPVLAWAVESSSSEGEEFPGTVRHLKENMEYADALVNYSKLEAIMQNKLLTVSRASVRESGEKFRDRMVLLGDGTREKAVDNYIVLGRGEPVPGVYLHAAAAFTFAREPVHEFKFGVRLLLDFLLSALVIFWVAIARYQHLGEKKRAFNWHRLQNRLVLFFTLGVGVLAFLLVRYTGILWLDFLLVMLALWLHPKVERKLSGEK